MVDRYYIVTLDSLGDTIHIKLDTIAQVLDLIKLINISINTDIDIHVEYIRSIKENKEC